jgi:hypothetical protein
MVRKREKSDLEISIISKIMARKKVHGWVNREESNRIR